MVASASTPLRAFMNPFNTSVNLTNLLNMCMENFGADKIFFDKMTDF